jgi:hypothetical protein
MSNSLPQERYKQSTIRTFVSTQQTLVERSPLIEHQIEEKASFKETAKQPTHPLDLLYRFNDERQTPALGFQQVDSEQDEEPMYTLAYLDPKLEQAWKEQVDPR